jgi:hypothetical protein
MPMFVTGSRGGAQDAIGIPLEVREWTEYEGEIAAVGERLDSGHEAEVVAVILSTRDRHADNPNRRSLGEWRDGYRALNREFRLEIGGIILFKNCRQIANAVYVSTWPNVLACNREEAPNVCKADHAVMRVVTPASAMGSGSDARQPARRVLNSRSAESRLRAGTERGSWGDVVVFYPEACAACADESVAAEEAFRLANLRELREPMFLLRGINSTGEVVAATKVALSRKRDVVNGQDVYVFPSADELSKSVHAYAVAIRNLSNAVKTFNLLPAGRWLLSPRTFFAPQRAEGTVSVSRAFRQQEGDKEVYVAKEVLFKLSEQSRDNAQYVNAIYPVDPFGHGQNLDLLGGLEYARDAILTVVRPDSNPESGSRESGARVEVTRNRALPQGVSSRGVNKSPDQAPQEVIPGSMPRVEGTRRHTGMTDDPFAGIPSVRARPRR